MSYFYGAFIAACQIYIVIALKWIWTYSEKQVQLLEAINSKLEEKEGE